MAKTTMIRIPQELSDKISIIKALHPKQKLSKQEWAIKILSNGLKQYEKQLEKYRFK